MLEVLFGNKNVEKILIFLFVNSKCYGTQLHRVFNTPLTPLQKALERLERGGVIFSQYEGKTRIYRLNQSFPCMKELELILKKAYTLLPAQEKKYFYTTNIHSFEKSSLRINTLLEFWDRLSSIKNLKVIAKSKSQEGLGWNARGQGDVLVTKEASYKLIFQEKGAWKNESGQETCFTNTFRWTLDRVSQVISLEHLRLGFDHPVFLFHLEPSSSHSLTSIDAHLCGEDSYFGQLHLDQYHLKLTWRIIGPKKNEEMEYYYF